MNLPAILSFIEERLGDLRLSASAASIIAGKPDCIRNMRRNVRRGPVGSAHGATLNALDRALQVPPGTLRRIGGEMVPSSGADRLRAELELLCAERALIDHRAAGVQHAISILENVQ